MAKETKLAAKETKKMVWLLTARKKNVKRLVKKVAALQRKLPNLSFWQKNMSYPIWVAFLLLNNYL